MDEDSDSHVYVAPLSINKATSDNSSHHNNDSIEQDTGFQHEEHAPARPKFQNFLRASYPFQPTATPSPSTVTLGLNAGDIVLVHSVHTNGWADGTLLETGSRGWLPTNYCEPYDYATMRPLLKAITEFWDIIRNGNDPTIGLFNNHDYMRGMVAGVRFLLEKSRCLTRDSHLIKEHDSLRRIRKILLADLSNLVKAAKQMHRYVTTDSQLSDIDQVLDAMLLKAFRVVTRAVNFFDCWSEGVALSRELMNRTSSRVERNLHPVVHQDRITNDTLSQNYSVQSFTEDIHQSLPQGHKSRPSRKLTHRMSLTGRPTGYDSSRLASERLNVTYDAFLGVLASFLGSHMQSRSSSELLLTTHQAVKACKRLLNVVEAIAMQDSSNFSSLAVVKDAMYDKITELVVAAKQVFRPLHSSDEEMIYLPSEGMQIVSAATACVSGAGRCVAKARIVLEEMGDFELEISLESLQTSPTKLQERSPLSAISSQEHRMFDSPTSDRSLLDPDHERSAAQSTIGVSVTAHRISQEGIFWASADSVINNSSTSSTSSSPEIPFENVPPNQYLQAQFSQPFMRGVVHSTASESTLVSSARDSGPSFMSDASTRATSPDRSFKPLPIPVDSQSLDNNQAQLQEELDEDEQEVMEQYYAHELLFNPEGRVIGGTLNAVVERLTAHDSAPDSFFVSTIYLTFRLFTTPKIFAEALAFRFQYINETPRIARVVQSHVLDILKGWLETHWRHECDETTLPYLEEFTKESVLPVLPAAGQGLLELVNTVAETHQPNTPRVLSSLGKNDTSLSDLNENGQPAPPPVITKSQLSLLKSWRSGGASISILDFDALEIARQITIKESALFSSILPEELLSTEFTKQSSSLAVNVRAMAQLSTDIANLVADSVLQLEEPKKRAATIKQWIKIANKCLELNNYDTMMAIICSINSSTILRLKKTWDLVNQKTINCFEGLKKVVDVSKNYSTLRQRISGHVPPCLPFVGMYLTDLTFVDHGNPATRELKSGEDTISVINLDKHMKTARIICDLQRFQKSYKLTEVSELQTWLQNELIRVRAAGEQNFQNHYRRSLILEPRESAPSRPLTIGTFASFSVQKDKFDFLTWAHIGKEKTASVNS